MGLAQYETHATPINACVRPSHCATRRTPVKYFLPFSFIRLRSTPWAASMFLAACICVLLAVTPSCGGFHAASASIPHKRYDQQRSHGARCNSLTSGSGGGSGDSARFSTARACSPGEVALTREAGKNEKLAALLAEDGISSVEVPCIAHQDGPDLPLLPAALTDPSLSYVVITSPEAAKVFLAGWESAGQPPVQVASVGKATGDALSRGGVTPVFTPSKANGETLAAEIPLLPPVGGVNSSGAGAGGDGDDEIASGRGGGSEGVAGPERVEPICRVLYPASARAQKTVETGLQARGFDVRRLNTYDTVPASWNERVEAAAAGAAVAAFGSPSAVKTWAARMGVVNGGRGAGVAAAEGAGRPRRKADTEVEEGDREDATSLSENGAIGFRALAACIGETSARACREAGWPESAIFYPEKPGMEGWAKAIRDALAAAKQKVPSAAPPPTA